MPVLEFSPALNRKIRSGDWKDQLVSTYQKTADAITRGAAEDAMDFAGYFMAEAKVCYDLYDQWLNLLPQFACGQSVPEGEWRGAVDRVTSLLRHPDGLPFVRQQRWLELQDLERTLQSVIAKQSTDHALALNEQVRERWRQLHDRDVDLVTGLLSFIADRLGEESIEAAFRFILVPFFEKRYARFDVRVNDWAQMLPVNLYLCIEAMRGHLSGPRRWGEMELIEEPDRYVLRFDPCGACGRTLRGDPVEGTPSRTRQPYGFHVTRKPYPWSWSMTGIDYYQVHTCLLFEILPIEMWGCPVRITEPPSYPGRECEKCTWYIYRDYRAVPEAFYERVGKSKPQWPGARASRLRP